MSENKQKIEKGAYMKYDGILLAVDFDGTISLDAKISKENADAVRYFESEGGMFTIASGRQFAFFGEMQKDMPFTAPYIGLNGTVINIPETNEIIHEKGMTKESIKAAFEYYKNEPDLMCCSMFSSELAMRFLINEDSVILRFADETDKNIRILYETTLPSLDDIDPTLTYDNGDEKLRTGIDIIDEFFDRSIYKVVLFSDRYTVTDERVRAIRDDIQDKIGNIVGISRSWPRGVELQNIDTSKGFALDFVKKYTGARLAIGIGNYENDLPLLRHADIAVSVGDASADCIAISDIVVAPCKEHSIADFIYNHLPKLL